MLVASRSGSAGPGKVLDVVVHDAVLAEARACGGAGRVAECEQERPGAGIAPQGLGDPLGGLQRLEREDDRLSAVRARLRLRLLRLHAGAQPARELRAERSGHAAGDLVVVDDEKDGTGRQARRTTWRADSVRCAVAWARAGAREREQRTPCGPPRAG